MRKYLSWPRGASTAVACLGAAATTLALCSAPLIAASQPAAAASKTKNVRGPWLEIPTAAGLYRVEATCPTGTQRKSVTLTLEELRAGEENSRSAVPPAGSRKKKFVPVPDGIFPERLIGMDLGYTGYQSVFVEIEVDKGTPLRVRAVAACR